MKTTIVTHKSHHHWQLGALLLLVFAPTAPAADVTVVDGDFASWNPFHFVTDDPFTAGPPPNVSFGSGQRLSSGGIPGAFLQLSHTFTTGDTSWNGAIKTDYTYDPQINGPITDLTIRADARGDNGSSAWQLVIEQGGRRYYSVPMRAIGSGLWEAVTNSNLVSTNFDTNPWAHTGGIAPDGNQPDFTSTAPPLRFGFMFGNRVGGIGTTSNVLGLDNFRLLVATKGSLPALEIRVSQVELCWNSRTNEWYQLLFRSTLTTNQWTPLDGTWVTGTGARYCTNDSVVAGQPQKFYQLSITNAPPQP